MLARRVQVETLGEVIHDLSMRSQRRGLAAQLICTNEGLSFGELEGEEEEERCHSREEFQCSASALPVLWCSWLILVEKA